MPTASPPPSIGRCSALSRSFLLGPDGPAGAPPGHRLRSGAYMAANEKQGQPRSANRSVHAFRGTADIALRRYDVARHGRVARSTSVSACDLSRPLKLPDATESICRRRDPWPRAFITLSRSA